VTDNLTRARRLFDVAPTGATAQRLLHIGTRYVKAGRLSRETFDTLIVIPVGQFLLSQVGIRAEEPTVSEASQADLEPIDVQGDS
jgi:hypothetical protein